MNSAAPATAASASSSAPRGAPGCGAVSSTAAIAGVTNSTRVCAAREARLRDLFSAPLCSETATNSSPVSAPARPPVVTAKSRHACGAYAMDQNLTPSAPVIAFWPAGALAADPGEPEQAGQEAHGAEPEGGQRDNVGPSSPFIPNGPAVTPDY